MLNCLKFKKLALSFHSSVSTGLTAWVIFVDCLEAMLVQSVRFIFVLFCFSDRKRNSCSLPQIWKVMKSTKKKTKIACNFTAQKSVNILGISILYFSLNINIFSFQN